MTAPKPGLQTTEFYVTVVTAIIGWLVALGVPVHISSQTISAIGALAGTALPMVYAIVRSMVKLQQPTPGAAPDGWLNDGVAGQSTVTPPAGGHDGLGGTSSLV